MYLHACIEKYLFSNWNVTSSIWKSRKDKQILTFPGIFHLFPLTHTNWCIANIHSIYPLATNWMSYVKNGSIILLNIPFNEMHQILCKWSVYKLLHEFSVNGGCLCSNTLTRNQHSVSSQSGKGWFSANQRPEIMRD